MGWTWLSTTAPQHVNQVQSWAKVAFFDYDYDNLKLAPVRDGIYPSVNEGSTMARKLVVYNDELSDPFVTMTVEARQNSTVYATATKTIRLPLGEHIMVPCTLQAPYTGTTGSRFEMVLKTSKGGVNKFTEVRTFTLNDFGADVTPSAIIRLGVAEATNLTSPYLKCFPDTLTIRAMRGVSPASCLITMANQGAGTLDNVTAQVGYASGASGWLTTQAAGQGNTQSLQANFSTNALAAGAYQAAVTVSSANAINTTARCGISLTIVEGRNPDSVTGIQPGLNYNCYEKTYQRGEMLGPLAQLTPVKTGVTEIPTVDVRTREDNFALRFTGCLRVTEPGEYKITLTSDEGSRMWIGTAVFIDNSMWTNREHSKTGSIFLKPGYHSIAIDYCEESAFQGLRVYWEGPGINGMQLIPASAYFHGTVMPLAAVRPGARVPGNFSLRPIAFSGRLVLRLGVPRRSPIRIDVFDISGRNFRSIDVGIVDAGYRETSLDLAAGHYFVRMRAGNMSLLSRVTMVK